MQYTVDIADAPGAVASFGFDIQYDPSLLQFTDAWERGALTEGFTQVGVSEIEPGLIRVGGFDVEKGIPAAAMDQAPASTAETKTGSETAEGAELAQELEQMFYSILDGLAQTDAPHRQAYDVLWDATQTIEEKRLLARMLATAAQKYEKGGESEEP